MTELRHLNPEADGRCGRVLEQELTNV